MALSWNEIKDRAVKFAKEWADTTNEEADAKPFLVEFFNVFGISNKRVATFEHRVKKLDDKDGYIDLLWKGMILIEMKSRGKNLDKAFGQAKDYLHGLKDHELPKYILVCDFEHFRLYDLEENNTIEFVLSELVHNVQNFAYLVGYQKKVYKEQDPANIKAAELMGKLHDRLEEIGYTGHPLEVYLVRLLFCLFAEDTTIFNKQQFQDYIEQRTNEDGSDLAARLQELFQVLNTPTDKRFKNLDEQLAEFPYVNGKLFEEILPTASFDSNMRKALLNCCYMDWSKISPAIFGSMFQSVMNPQERRNLGAHYTSEKNILKLITPLFLDELRQEFNDIIQSASKGAARTKKLTEFHKKIRSLTFLDPACGCGNFLVITYRELRLLELDILRALHTSGQGVLDVKDIIWVDVDQFYGIEYEEFPARIAEVAMWLIDHQMNMLVSNEFGQYYVRLPLKKSATIVHGDALEIEWQTLLNPVNTIDVIANHANIYIANEPAVQYGEVNVQVNSYSVHKGKPKQSNEIKFNYIIGNPPFIGAMMMNEKQRENVHAVFRNEVKSFGVLDYVTCWYYKAAKYILGTRTKVAFVSTNSIVQGEQTSILWQPLVNKFGVRIHFAHRTFKWNNEAKGKAAVFCIIIGFANYDAQSKSIYDYEDINGEAHEIKVKNINSYLVDAKDVFIENISKPICNVPKMSFGSMPRDGGHFIFTKEEADKFKNENPRATKWIRPYTGAQEFINGYSRYCLWLIDITPNEIRNLPAVLDRVEKVKSFRLASKADSTRRFANTPTLFCQIAQPQTDFLLIPRVSSERRKFIPIGYMNATTIANDQVLTVSNTTLFHFGTLTSSMHMAWVKHICGRLKSDYRYSKDIVYNNYPWPENPTDKQIKTIEEKAQKVLDARALFPNSSLADLYDPLTMPPELVKAHNELDKAVDLAYRAQPFTSEANRMEFLFELYEKYTATLFTNEKPKKTRKKNASE